MIVRRQDDSWCVGCRRSLQLWKWIKPDLTLRSPLAATSSTIGSRGAIKKAPPPCISAMARSFSAPRPAVANPAIESCHEVEPFAAAYRLDQPIVASVCLHRSAPDRFLVLSPCGVCRERLAVHGPDVLVAVADQNDPTNAVWKPLRAVLPDYWQVVFTEDSSNPWTSRQGRRGGARDDDLV